MLDSVDVVISKVELVVVWRTMGTLLSKSSANKEAAQQQAAAAASDKTSSSKPTEAAEASFLTVVKPQEFLSSLIGSGLIIPLSAV